MAEEKQVEQTTQTDVSRETTETKQEEVKEVNNNSFSEEDVNNIVKQRLAKERASIYKKLDVDDLDTAINAVKQSREAEEKEKKMKL